MSTDQDNTSQMSPTAVTLSRKAWTAYLGISVRALLLLGVGGFALYSLPDYQWLIVLVMLFGALLIAYRILHLRSYRLYFDQAGVWIYAGILPWKRGVTGVKWRDLDEALFVNDFWSWLSRSYTIQLKHRFTKAVEISADHMASGKQAVLTINQEHQRYIAAEPNPVLPQ